MFGLENKEPKRFEFDLEKQLKKSDSETKKILGQIDKRSNELKSALREGKASENFDQCGVLLQAYAALERVVKRTTRK
ncbi:MAG: EscE/YscE/SsaE family type III secretion system needle protein co-chaperone [Simkaniaceae bacterium]